MKTRVGPYEIRERLGVGGIGEVYEALDSMLGRPVAIKALRAEFSADPVFVERFRAEATNLARLLHPNVATLFALHAEDGQLFMVMELVRGRMLETVIQEGGRMETGACLKIVGQAVAGLSYAHRMGLIHRDIKPANLMITESGLVKIMDFGIARLRGTQRMTRQGEMIGTLAYMAPEQLKGGEGDERSDIYSLAIVVYEMLSGRVPFTADSEYDLIRAQVEQPPPPLTGIDPAVAAALARALAKRPEDRFATVAEFGRAIGADPEGVVSGPPAAVVKRPARPSAVMTPMVALGAAAALLLAVGGWILWDTTRPAPPAKAEAKAAPPPPLPAAAPAPVVTPMAGSAPTSMIAAVAAPPQDVTPSRPPERGQAPEEVIPHQPDLPAVTTPAATPAISAPAKAKATTAMTSIQGTVSDIRDNSTFTVGGRQVQLFGINAAQGPTGVLQGVLQSSGGHAMCTAVGGQGGQGPVIVAKCVTRKGADLAMAVLTEGGARASGGAPLEYRNAEMVARRRGTGMWSGN
jgi:serine/threonine-protein kinase